MTLREIKAMFNVGDTWNAVNTYIPAINGDRKIIEIRDDGIIASTNLYRNIHTEWPKASQIIAARPGYIKIRFAEHLHLDGHTLELKKNECGQKD